MSRPTDKGFTLIEALLALAILAVAVGGIMTVRSNAIENARRAQTERIGTMLAEQLLSQIALVPAQVTTSFREFSDYPGFFYRFVVEQVEIEPVGPCIKVRIEVRRASPAGTSEADEVIAIETFVDRQLGEGEP